MEEENAKQNAKENTKEQNKIVLKKVTYFF